MSSYSGATALDLLFWPGVAFCIVLVIALFLYWVSR